MLCFVCHRNLPKAFSHEHHTTPQAVGGVDKGTVTLCASCHTNLHAVEKMLSGPRAAQAQDAVQSFYGADGDAARRCMELAIKAMRHMAEKESGQFKIEAHEDVEVMIELPSAIKNALMLIGREARDPVSNKRLGMAGAARSILIESVLRRFPTIKAEIQKSTESKMRQNPDQHYARPKRRAVKG